MADSSGKYDKECTWVRETTKARGVIIMVIEGDRGEGFSAQVAPDIAERIPEMLRLMATQIEFWNKNSS